MVAKIFIDGEAGTTGLQIRERLENRQDLELLAIAPERRKDISARAELLNTADVAILCLPDDAAKESVRLIENETTRVIDASTAFRVADDWTYGFAEMSRAQSAEIAASKRVSNPGCYPQGVIATIRPLIEEGLLPAAYLLNVNAISGYSGGGRSMVETYEAPDITPPAFMPYALGYAHKHLPEMKLYAGLSQVPLFQPSVGNFRQGMVDMIPLQFAHLAKIPTGAEVHEAIADHFAGIENSFVEVAPFEAVNSSGKLDPELHNGTNKMTLHVFANDTQAQVMLMAVYDNLGKGASGAAVQNLNLMLGIDPKTGL